jgi:hypothetical protein
MIKCQSDIFDLISLQTTINTGAKHSIIQVTHIFSHFSLKHASLSPLNMATAINSR